MDYIDQLNKVNKIIASISKTTGIAATEISEDLKCLRVVDSFEKIKENSQDRILDICTELGVSTKTIYSFKAQKITISKKGES
ncbi:hypothetical protein [Thalassobellus citreus]|uniref:hypothetical protein n=1 Tax=Thalassobellus citreus TaxID=3367752 RepID=UPI00379D0241